MMSSKTSRSLRSAPETFWSHVKKCRIFMDDLKGKDVLGGRKGGMPEMVFEYILKKNGINPQKDLSINQSIDFGSTAAAFSGGQADYTIEFEPSATALEAENSGYVVASLGVDSGYVHTPPIVPKQVI